MAGRTAVDPRVIEQFLFQEAMYLDRGLWDEWLDLFTDDGLYWVPAAPDQEDPYNHVSLYFEDKILRQMRVQRMRHEQAFSMHSPVRGSRILGNVLVEEHDETTGACRVSSAFHLLELQFGEQHVYGGSYTHELVPVGDSYKIKLKRVDLINCDQPLEIMQAFI